MSNPVPIPHPKRRSPVRLAVSPLSPPFFFSQSPHRDFYFKLSNKAFKLNWVYSTYLEAYVTCQKHIFNVNEQEDLNSKYKNLTKEHKEFDKWLQKKIGLSAPKIPEITGKINTQTPIISVEHTKFYNIMHLMHPDDRALFKSIHADTAYLLYHPRHIIDVFRIKANHGIPFSKDINNFLKETSKYLPLKDPKKHDEFMERVWKGFFSEHASKFYKMLVEFGYDKLLFPAMAKSPDYRQQRDMVLTHLSQSVGMRDKAVLMQLLQVAPELDYQASSSTFSI